MECVRRREAATSASSTIAAAVSPGPRRRLGRPSSPTLKRISSRQLILRTVSRVRSSLSSVTSARTSASLHSTQAGRRLIRRSQAAGVSASGTNRKAHDSEAVESSNFRNGGVQ